MQSYYDIVTDSGNNPISGALVYVYDSLGALATIYSDDGLTLQSNPITTNASGGWIFYAANGIYSAVITAAGYTSKTITGITLNDPTPSQGAVDIQEFTTVGTSTWTKPLGARYVEVLMYGGGGGGSSGDRRGSSTAAQVFGGSGGASGSRVEIKLPASALSATETVVVGAGGAGGLAQTIDAQPGISGANGTISQFSTYIASFGGGGGVVGGARRLSIEPTRTANTLYQPNGGQGNANPGTAGGRGGFTGGGGGGGSGFNAGSTTSQTGAAGGLGGAVFSNDINGTGNGGAAGTAGGNGGDGADAPAGYWVGGSGGGSGGCTSTQAGSGGKGGYPSGGGGGGAAASGAFNSGAGGDGGDGFVRVVTYL